MVRRRLTIKRIDPWSVLKFGAIVNLAMLAIGLLVAYVGWFVIERLNIVDQVCGIATDVGFTQCGVNFSGLFRALVLLGLLWVVVQTAVFVFLSFLHNLIADLTGGLTLSVLDDTPGAAARGEVGRSVVTASTPPAPARTGAQPTGAQPAAVAGRRADAAPEPRREAPAPEPRREAPAPEPEPTVPPQPAQSARSRVEASGDELFGGR